MLTRLILLKQNSNYSQHLKGGEKMHGLLYSCLLLFISVTLTLAQDPIVGCPLSDLSNSAIQGLITADSSFGDGNPDTIDVRSRNTTCLAVGRERGGFRYTTETVEFEGITGVQIAQIDFVCASISGIGLVWDIDQLTLINAATRDSLAAIQAPATDCARCTVDATGPNDDSLLHCERCDPECLLVEQQLCYGSSSTQCCTVYIDDVCMNECPPNQIATAATNFECVCNLACQNGGSPNPSCTQCNCTSPLLTGPFCEDPCSPDQCVNGTCSPDGNFPGFNCTCDPGFTGTLCDQVIDPCEGGPCGVNGRCMPVNITEFVCVCDPGFTGTLCEIEINQCEPNPCLNGGLCVRGTFPEFTCDCLPNFSGNICQICNLPNCRICSLTEGICTECNGGYLLVEGRCGIDCSICDQRETQNQINICNYYCLLNAWVEDVNMQGLTISSFNEPSSDLTKLEQQQQIVDDATTAEEVWTNEARTTSDALSSLQSPARDGVELSQWVSASETWLRNTERWLEYIRTEVDTDFPSFDFESLISQLETDPQEAYDQINEMWRRVTNEFSARILLRET